MFMQNFIKLSAAVHELSYTKTFCPISQSWKKNPKIRSRNLDLWPMTLKFSGFRGVVKVGAKFHGASCSGSWVIVSCAEWKKLRRKQYSHAEVAATWWNAEQKSTWRTNERSLWDRINHTRNNNKSQNHIVNVPPAAGQPRITQASIILIVVNEAACTQAETIQRRTTPSFIKRCRHILDRNSHVSSWIFTILPPVETRMNVLWGSCRIYNLLPTVSPHYRVKLKPHKQRILKSFFSSQYFITQQKNESVCEINKQFFYKTCSKCRLVGKFLHQSSSQNFFYIPTGFRSKFYLQTQHVSFLLKQTFVMSDVT